MKYVKILLLFWCLTGLGIAKADARYVRKLIEPDFFIPEQDRMHKQEKLPQIKKIIQPTDNFSQIPEYKTKYNKYLAETAVFAKTKKLVDNQELSNCLNKMAAGEIFEVNKEDAAVKITTKEQQEFWNLAKKLAE